MRSTVVNMILMVSMIVTSCNQEHKTKDNRIIPIKDFKDKTIDLNEVIADVKIVPIIPNSDYVIGHIKDLCLVDNIIYILDDITASVFLFDAHNGKFIKNINRKGNGPNEYINPVAISNRKDQIFLLDLAAMRLIRFDKQMNAQETIQLQFPASDFIATEQGFLFYNLSASPEVHRFVYTDPTGNILKSYIPVKENDLAGQQFDLPDNKLSITSDNRIYASESFSNDIYEWKEGDFELACQSDFSGLNIPKTINPWSVNLFDEPYAFNCGFFVFPELLVTSFIYKSNRYYNFVNQNNGEQRCGMVEDKTNQLPFFPQWQQQNCLLGVCSYEIGRAHV